MFCPRSGGFFCADSRASPAPPWARLLACFMLPDAGGSSSPWATLCGWIGRGRRPAPASGAPIATPSAPSVGAAPRAAVKRGSLRCRAPGAGDGGALTARVPRKRSERGTPGAGRRPDPISRGLKLSGRGAIVAPVVRFAGVFALSGSHYPANHKNPTQSLAGAQNATEPTQL